MSKFQEISNNFAYRLHNFTTHSVDCQNILFKLNEDKQNIVILGTHYDSRAKSTKDPDLANRDSPVPGANDGASGSAVLIELAKALYNQRDNLSCQIWFLFFDAEDQGRDNDYGIDNWDWCEGSKEFVSNINNFYDSETENFDCMVLLDMVGGENLRFINEQYSTSSLLNELFAVGRQLGYTNQFPSNPEVASIIDDHTPFLDIGISSADLIINFWDNSGWPYHHTTQDDINSISNFSLDVTGKTLEQFIYNNYINNPENSYQGNFPWTKDRNILSIDILIIIIIIVIFVCAIIELFIITKKEANKSIEVKK
ncbi:MAG: M28 family peptidase [Promethearchaeota archaeon]